MTVFLFPFLCLGPLERPKKKGDTNSEKSRDQARHHTPTLGREGQGGRKIVSTFLVDYELPRGREIAEGGTYNETTRY